MDKALKKIKNITKHLLTTLGYLNLAQVKNIVDNRVTKCKH